MMPDLGKYALEVSLAYAVSLVVLAAVTLFVIRRAAHARRMLEQVESQTRKAREG